MGNYANYVTTDATPIDCNYLMYDTSDGASVESVFNIYVRRSDGKSTIYHVQCLVDYTGASTQTLHARVVFCAVDKMGDSELDSTAVSYRIEDGQVILVLTGQASQDIGWAVVPVSEFPWLAIRDA